MTVYQHKKTKNLFSSLLPLLLVTTLLLSACSTTPTHRRSDPHPLHITHRSTQAEIKAVSHARVSPETGLADPEKPNSFHLGSRNLWRVMADDFTLPDETDDIPAVKNQINWFMTHPSYLTKVTTQAQPYLYYVYQQVCARNLPAELALMPMIESAYNPFAINSNSGAAGLWQMMPGTASGFGLHVDWWYDGRRDISASTNAALDYLAYLGNFFNEDWELAMAAYDTGEGNIQSAIERNVRLGNSTDFWSLHLPHETQSYVPKILALATILKHPDRYPFDFPAIPNEPYLSAVNLGSQIDLHQAAHMANLSLAELTQLNPGYNRWATDPNGSFQLLLPVNKVALFKKNLAELISTNQKITWYRVTTKKGDTLDSIALQYQTTPRAIKEANKLIKNKIKPGQILLIPNSALNQKNNPLDITVSTDENNTPEIDGSSTQSDSEKNYTQYVGEKINNLPETNVIHHVVTSGETLKNIADQYCVKIHEIVYWNQLKNESLKKGMDLVIWPSKSFAAKQQALREKEKNHRKQKTFSKHKEKQAKLKKKKTNRTHSKSKLNHQKKKTHEKNNNPRKKSTTQHHSKKHH